MDSLVIAGKEYISAKRAAREHSYTMDYVGQLIRGGKLLGQKVGRAWYVENDSLMAYVRSLAGKEMKGPSYVQQIPVQTVVETASTPAVVLHVEQPIVDEQVSDEESNTEAAVVVAEKVNTEDSVQSPIEVVQEEKVSDPHTVLTYTKDEGEVLPQLSARAIVTPQENEVSTGEIKITRIHQQPVQVRSEAPASRVSTPRFGGHVSTVVSSVPQGAHFVAPYVDHHPAKRGSLVPALVAAGLAIAVFALAGGSLFFAKTMNYEGATSAVTKGFTYSNLGN